MSPRLSEVMYLTLESLKKPNLREPPLPLLPKKPPLPN